MQVGVIGINHKLATLALRESLLKTILLPRHAHFHYVPIITCNRIEIYFSSRDLVTTHGILLQLLCEGIEDEVAHKLYSYFKEDCFLHLAKVTAGLDSAILFESEIQGQVKRAYQEAIIERPLSSELHFIFQKSLRLGKKVRAHFPTTKEMPTLEQIVENVGESLLGSLKERRILFVGLSEINCKIAHYLSQQGISKITFCNRSVHQGWKSFPLYDLSHLSEWHAYDMTIFGTRSLDYLLREGKSLKEKRVILDLGVPRNVDPKVGNTAFVTLLHVDQLHQLVSGKRKREMENLAKIEGEEITQGVTRHLQNFYMKRRIVFPMQNYKQNV